LVQDTIVRALPHLDRLEARNPGALQGYLRQALLNRMRDEIRRIDRRPVRDADDAAVAERADVSPSPLEEAIGREMLGRYEVALSRLTDEERGAIVMRVELGMPFAEIASELGKPTADAARMHHARALLRLAEEMDHGS
jgi:RNA polymerase sigma-70 factor (ECF subfamily)